MSSLIAPLSLLVTTFFWGVTFTVVKDAVAQVDVFVFLAQRFLIAFLLMLPVGLLRFRHLSPRVAGHGILMGVFLFGSYAFQTVALRFTSASNTAFLTGLNVVMVPVLGAVLCRQRINRNVAGAVVLALAGLYLLCGGSGGDFNRGDLLAAVCAVCVSLHMLSTGEFAAKNDVYWLTLIQLATVALLSITATFGRGLTIMQTYPKMIPTLGICAIFATVFAFLVQTTMQRRLSATHTALIFCLEPVFAAAYACTVGSESLGRTEMAGAALIVGAMIFSQVGQPEEAGGQVSAMIAEAED